MSITTKTGDNGETGILFGHRVRKDELRVHATGALDELNASLGLARALVMSKHRNDSEGPSRLPPEETSGISAIDQVQKELFSLMGQISTLPEDWHRYRSSGYSVLGHDSISWLEEAITSLEEELPTPKHWTVPGAAGLPATAALEVARTVCRRAERHIMSLLPEIAGVPDDFNGLVYLNRLSDYLWLLARQWELSG